MLHNRDTGDGYRRLLDAEAAVRDFDSCTVLWHKENPLCAADSSLLLQLHLANFTLWHLEDRARDPQATDAEIASLKRSIDKTNQTRNDLVERFDADLLRSLQQVDLPNADAPLHSETPGLILDRLSILALKVFHTHEEAHRADASATHRERNQQRLLVLQQQKLDLSHCLADLWNEVCNGSRGYRQYRQMKMYNDPELNPVLYTAHGGTVSTDA